MTDKKYPSKKKNWVAFDLSINLRKLAIDPQNFAATHNKGVSLQSLGNYTQAIQYYDKALAIKPTDGNTLMAKKEAQSLLQQ